MIDEFPWLLGSSAGEAQRTLSAVQAVIEEERDESDIKLVLCGSAVAQMEALQSETSPLHGRLIPFELRALPFERAALFLPDHPAEDAFVRFAIAGGMPRYLAALQNGPLRDSVCAQMLRPDSPLWDEGRTIVGQELREPAVYFSVVEQLASGAKSFSDIAAALKMAGGPVSKYVRQLTDLRLVRKDQPIGASPSDRGNHWVLDDPFLRFWFRFVFPFQVDLEAGLGPEALYETEIAPDLADHVSPVFEERCRQYVRMRHGGAATNVGRWWGNALNAHRKAGVRTTEEIDVVGMARGRVTVVGEAKWTSRRLDVSILRDLEQFKLPALRQAGFKMAATPSTLLFSRAGFTDGLHAAAAEDSTLNLVDIDDVLSTRP